MSYEFWIMFPVSIVVATVAMASGVEGATFFAPIFMLGLGLPPEVAILGSWLASEVPPVVLKAILGVGLLAVAASFLRSPHPEDVAVLDESIRRRYGGEEAERELTAADGEVIRYTVCNRGEGRLLAGLGSLFMGMISTGLGELNGYFLLQRCRVPSKVAVATSVFVVAVTALSAASGHLVRFLQNGPETLDTVLALVVFTVPGVIVGGQIGPLVASRVPQHTLERAMGVLFILVAVFMLGDVIR